MSTDDMGETSGQHDQPPQSFQPSCEASNLRNMIGQIGDQIADADHRHSQALDDLQNRLATLGQVAQDMRSMLPDALMPSLDRIEHSMTALSATIADEDRTASILAPLSFWDSVEQPQADFAGSDQTGPLPLKSATEGGCNPSQSGTDGLARTTVMPVIDKFDVVDSTQGSLGDEPWDSKTAEALTSLYEQDEARLAALAAAETSGDGGDEERWQQPPAIASATQVATQSDPQLDTEDEPGAMTREGVDDTGMPTPAMTDSMDDKDLQDHRLALAATAVDENVPAVMEAPASTASTIEIGAIGQVERRWLEERFGDIASKLEQSLAGLKPDSSVNVLDQRFAKLEESLGHALSDTATRADLAGLRTIETQVEELTGRLDTVQSHFGRLDTIELELKSLADRVSEENFEKLLERSGAPFIPEQDQHVAAVAQQVSERLPLIEAALQTLTERVSDDRLAAVVGQMQPGQPDPDAMAKRVAEHISEQLQHAARPGADLTSAHIDGLREMVQGLANEQRHGEEQTTTMLDTMQQAMIRLLDRMDAMETAQGSRQGQGELDPLGSYDGFGATGVDADPMSDTDPQQRRSRQDPAEEARYVPNQQAALAAGFESQGVADNPPIDRDDQLAEDLALLAPEAGAPASAADPLADVTGERHPDADALGVQTLARDDIVASARRAARKASGQPLDGPHRAKADANRADPAPLAKVRSLSRVSMVLLCLVVVGATFVLVRSTGLLMTSSPTVEVPANASQPTSGGSLNNLKDADSKAAPSPDANSPSPSGGFKPRSGGSDVLGEKQQRAHATGYIPDRLGIVEGMVKAESSTPGTAMTGGLPAGSSEFVRQYTGGTPASTQIALHKEPNVAGAGNAAPANIDLPPLTIGPLSLRNAAAHGDAAAQFEVAARFAQGKGVPQSLSEAIKWYRRSAAQGFAPAQYRLGSMYERGLGMTTDVQRARIWYRRAAEQGIIKAMHNLAVLSTGRHSEKPDYQLAAKWFQKAAEHGLTDSQFNLAIIHQSGLIAARDPKQAFKWFSLAARSGDEQAARQRHNIKQELSSDDIAKLEDEIRAWRPKLANETLNNPRLAGQLWQTSKRQ